LHKKILITIKGKKLEQLFQKDYKYLLNDMIRNIENLEGVKVEKIKLV